MRMGLASFLGKKQKVDNSWVARYKHLSPEQFKKQVAEDVLRTSCYKALSFPAYGSLKNYSLFEKVVHQISTISLMADIACGFAGGVEQFKEDYATLHAARAIWQAVHIGFRPMWIAPALLQAFSYSRLPKKISALNRVCPVGLILLPSGYIKNPEGKYLKWILFYHALPGDRITDEVHYEAEEGSSAGLYWCTQLDNFGEVYAGYDALSVIDEKLIIDNGDNYTLYSNDGNKTLEDEEIDFVRKIPNLIIQPLLYMQMEKITLPPVTPQTQGFSANRKAKYKKIPPLIIGENYLIKTQRDATGQSRPHGSPVTHWRSGHWRCQPYGGKDNQAYKTIWIEPILVNKPGGC